jgi:hypothetical protein
MLCLAGARGTSWPTRGGGASVCAYTLARFTLAARGRASHLTAPLSAAARSAPELRAYLLKISTQHHLAKPGIMAGLLSCFSPLLPSQLRPAHANEDEKAELSEKAGLVRPRARLAGSDRPQAAKADTTERVWKLREVMWKEGLGA